MQESLQGENRWRKNIKARRCASRIKIKRLVAEAIHSCIFYSRHLSKYFVSNKFRTAAKQLAAVRIFVWKF